VKAKQTKRPARLTKTIRGYIRLVVIPHKANQYRPHLIRRYSLVAVLLVVIALHGGYSFLLPGTVLGDAAPITADELLKETNSERVSRQLKPLAMDEKLSQAAFLKAQDMLQKQYWAHTAPDGTAPWRWFGDAGYNYTYAGENLAKNFRTSDAALTAWMASSEHKANILGKNYLDVGFAVVDGVLEGKNTTIIVALYGAPASQGVAGTQVTAVAQKHTISPLTQLGIAVQSMPPTALGSVMLMLVVMGFASLAHAYRAKLPKQLYNSWYRHHGAAKASGLLALCFVIIVLYSGGQI